MKMVFPYAVTFTQKVEIKRNQMEQGLMATSDIK